MRMSTVFAIDDRPNQRNLSSLADPDSQHPVMVLHVADKQERCALIAY